jgi:hypothetical protein
MCGSEIERPESSKETIRHAPIPALECVSGASETTAPEPEADILNLDPLMASEELSARMERFSNLNSDMATLLAEMSREVKKTMDQLLQVRAEVETKQEELKTLYDIEVSAAEREQLMEDYRRQKEHFERLMEGQRSAWEEGRERQAQEEKDYLENLQARRQREEDEYRNVQMIEQMKAQQKFEEELRTIRQKFLEEQELLKGDFAEREQSLHEKELEWARLVQELEQFMSNLSQRTQAQTAVPIDPPKQPPLAQSAASVPNSSLSCENGQDFIGRGEEDSWKFSFYPEDSTVRDNASGEGDRDSDFPKSSMAANGSTEETKPSLSSLIELSPLQSRKAECLNGDPSVKRESAPLKFCPKKSTNSKSEV